VTFKDAKQLPAGYGVDALGVSAQA